MMWQELHFIVVTLNAVAALSPVIKIGMVLRAGVLLYGPSSRRAIFTEDSRGGAAELAFKYAVYRINKDGSILPDSTLVYDIQYTPATDSFKTYRRACTHIKAGAVALFSGAGPLLDSTITAVGRSLHVPHFIVAPHAEYNHNHSHYMIGMYPERSVIDRAFIDLTAYLNWTRMAVIYEDYGYGVISILNIASDGRDMYAVHVDSPHQYRHALAQLKAQQITHIIVDTDPKMLRHLARAILQLQMNNENYHYIFTSFDIELFDLEDFYYNRVNMSGWRIVDRESDKVKETLLLMETFHPIGASILTNGLIKTEPALIYDAVQVLALALASSKDVSMTNVSCEDGVPWSRGKALMENINKIKAHGLTGDIQLTSGIRTNLSLQLMRVSGGERGGVVRAGGWGLNHGLQVTDPAAYKRNPPPNVTLTIVTVEEKPYVMVKEGWNLQGNARFEGFCIDLLSRVASTAGFHYKLRLVPDNMYGARDPVTGQWNGIVRELMDRKADIAVASMTINYAREAVIDFTKPFMNLGIGILFKVPTSQPTRLFSFLNPLAIEIWLYVLAAYILVSFTLFVMARFSPYEWSSSDHVCGHDAKLLTNQFSVCNSFWFITGTFLRQGSGLNPKATSTRIVGGIWWFFTLIILSSYTANLAAFLTVERTVLPIQSAADLAAQNSVQYGTLNGGSTMTFFRDSNIDIYQKMWQHMSTASPPALVSSYEEGVKKVLQGNYAFLMESTMLDHRVQRDCNLTQIGGLLDSKGYGIATWKGSPWRDKISLAILELQERGVIQILYDKWWKNTGDVCNRDGKDSKANPLGVQNIGGVFVTLLCGLALAIMVAILEFCWNTKKHASNERQSLCSEMGQELRGAMRGGGRGRGAGCPHCAHAQRETSMSSVELRTLGS